MRSIIPAWCAVGALIWPGFVGAGRPAEAASARKETLPALAQASGRIFVGTVRRIQYQRDARSGLIYTHVSFDKLTFIKGRPPATGAAIVLRLAGGLDEGDTLVHVAGIPRFQLGERYVLFQKAGPWTFCPLTGWDQGCYHLVRGARCPVPGPAKAPASRLAKRLAPASAGHRAPGTGHGSEATTWVVLDANDAPVLGVRDGRLQRPRPRAGSAMGSGRPAAGRDRLSLFGAAVPGSRPGWSGEPDAIRIHDLADTPGGSMAPRAGEAPPAITRYVGRKRTASNAGRRPTPPPAGAMSATAFLAEIRRAAASTASRRTARIEEAPSPLRTRAVSTPGY
jgi:hypothetical protein